MKSQNLRNKIFGAIGIVWGGLMILYWIISSTPPALQARPGYATGQMVAHVFAIVLFAAGLYYFFKKVPKAEG